MGAFPQNGFPQHQPAWGGPQQGFNPQGTVPQGNFGGGFPQGGYGGQSQFNPQAAGFVPGPPYGDNEFPHENMVSMAGQVYPNQFMPQGWEFRPTDKGGMLTANIKLRSAWQGGVRCTFIKLIAFGDIAAALKNELSPGRLIRFTGEYRENGYQSKRDGKNKRVTQVLLKSFNNQPPYQLGGNMRLIDELPQRRQQGGGNWGGQQQGNWGGQQPQPNWAPPQQQPFANQGVPNQGTQAPWNGAPAVNPQANWAPPQGQAPQGAPNFLPPQGQQPQLFPQGQQLPQQAPQQAPQLAPQGWPTGGQFAPPQGGPIPQGGQFPPQ